MRLLENGKLSEFDTDCPMTRAVLSRLGDKWSVRVGVLLSEGTRRFNARKRQVTGISQRVLTSTLRDLERDGLVQRTVTPTNPPQVDYALTPMGRTFLGPLVTLATWTDEHRVELTRAQDAFAQAQTKKDAAHPVDEE